MNAKILIVDDEPNVRLMYRSALEGCCYEIYEADSGAKALNHCKKQLPDVAILDLRMPGGLSGLELLDEMKKLNIQTPVVFVSAYADVPNAVNAMKLGAIDFLQKPILPDQLRNIIKDILIRHESGKSKDEPQDFEYFLRCTKRAINLRDFVAAKQYIIKGLEMEPDSIHALNLAGVIFEMCEEFDQARRYYGQAIKRNKNFEPAQANMRRIFELFNFGISDEPFNLNNK